MTIRDQMDDILEAKGFYRKHVAQERNALYRAVADAVMGTQKKTELLIRAVAAWRKSPNGVTWAQYCDGYDGGTHREVGELANVLNTSFYILDSFNPSLQLLRIDPTTDMGDLRWATKLKLPNLKDPVTAKEYARENTPVFLCHSGDNQYDPVYPKSTITAAGEIQSLLYTLLYVDVFGVTDALCAADKMLNGFDDPFSKPEILNAEFKGTAMQALEENCIPFPYKVAKALDPYCYRNIEFDVWKKEVRGNLTAGAVAPSRLALGGSTRRRNFTVTDLAPGHPILLRNVDGMPGELYGFYLAALCDKKTIEVYVPGMDMSIFLPRNVINPIKSVPDYLGKWVSYENRSGVMYYLKPNERPSIVYDSRSNQLSHICAPTYAPPRQEYLVDETSSASNRRGKPKRRNWSPQPRRGRGSDRNLLTRGKRSDFREPSPPPLGRRTDKSDPRVQPPSASSHSNSQDRDNEPWSSVEDTPMRPHNSRSYWSPRQSYNPRGQTYQPPMEPRLRQVRSMPTQMPKQPTQMPKQPTQMPKQPTQMPKQPTQMPKTHTQSPVQASDVNLMDKLLALKAPPKGKHLPASQPPTLNQSSETTNTLPSLPNHGNDFVPVAPTSAGMPPLYPGSPMFATFGPGAYPSRIVVPSSYSSQNMQSPVTSDGGPGFSVDYNGNIAYNPQQSQSYGQNLYFCSTPNATAPMEPSYMVQPITPSFPGPLTPMTTPLAPNTVFQFPGPPTPVIYAQPHPSTPGMAPQGSNTASASSGGDSLYFQFPSVPSSQPF